jgi:hypothetical protein
MDYPSTGDEAQAVIASFTPERVSADTLEVADAVGADRFTPPRDRQTLTEICRGTELLIPLPVELMRMLRDSEKRMTYNRRPRR